MIRWCSRATSRLLLACLFAFSGSVAAQNEIPNTLTAAETAAGWRLLFDGKKAGGLRGVQKADFLKAGWKIEKGELLLAKDFKNMGTVTGGDLMTGEAFLDFEFSFDWKLSVSSNTGLRYLVRAGLRGSPTGFEYQIIDDVHHPEGLKGGPIRRTGALDGIIPPVEEKRLNEPGQWNQGRLLVQANHVEHWLNGQKVLEYELGSRALAAAGRATKLKVGPGFGMKFKSPLVLVDEGDEVAFRNLKVRLLPPVPAATPAPLPAVAPPSPDSPSRTGLPAATNPASPLAPLPPTPPDLQ